jgi:HD-GYP domain-containing protein (c-di-GMP phosphodiesterase class II)
VKAGEGGTFGVCRPGYGKTEAPRWRRTSSVGTAAACPPGPRASPPSAPLADAAAHESLLVLADVADLKSPWTNGHSRAVAALALQACGPAAEAAALVHDLGRVAVPNTIWDKPGPFTRDERDRAEAHALVTDQLLRRVPYTATPAGAAFAAHECLDGSGYHRRVTGAHLDEVQRVIAAADSFQAMTCRIARIAPRTHPRMLPSSCGR